MAKATFKLPEDFLLKVSSLENKTDEIIPKVLKEGGEIVKDKVKSNLKAVIGKETKFKSRSSGQLIKALGVSPTGIDRNGNYNVKVGFSEDRDDGKSNAMLASVIEHGKSGQRAKPFLKPAKSASKKTCIETMKRKLDKEIEKL